MARKWKNNWQLTGPVNIKQIYNLLSQFPYNLLSSANAEYFYSLLGHVITVS